MPVRGGAVSDEAVRVAGGLHIEGELAAVARIESPQSTMDWAGLATGSPSASCRDPMLHIRCKPVDGAFVNPEAFSTVLAAAKGGAPWAWTRLYEELSGPLLGYARARGAVDPADVVGEVFLEVARRVANFEGSWEAFRGWTFLLASRRVIDDHRRRQRRPEDASAGVPDLPSSDSTEGTYERDDAAKQAHALLATLSPDQREVLLLRIFGELSIDEVARLTGRSVTGVKALQRRGLGALRRKISLEEVSR